MHNILNQLIREHLELSSEYVGPTHNNLEAPIFFEMDENDEKVNEIVEKWDRVLDHLDEYPYRRIIKSHLPAFLLPKGIWTVKPKVIYISREAKDVAVSFYHMCRNELVPYERSAEQFFHSFRHGYAAFGPFYEHIHSFHQLRHLDHLLILTYEELSTNTFDCIKRISEFLECSYTDNQLEQLIEYASFEKMRKNIKYNFSMDQDK